ncbi:MAG: GntR family transcriptional regulator [Candidatus Eremiobacteraeota bacterium]|nr:GntR family transcriptional regulator [Candidatus Eremiobacteraeota bacterium]
MASLGSRSARAVLLGHLERPRSLRDQVYDRLREAILSGELVAGAPVIEADIAKTLGASRTPVREALRRLETEGMLEPRGRRGSVVRELKRDEVECIFEIREALETLAARRATRRMNAAHFDELEQLLESMSTHVEDTREMERLETQFHDRILALADGQRLKRMLGDLRADILPWRFVALSTLARRRATIDEHAAMLSAMRSKDEAAVVRATARHIRNARSSVLAQGDAA